MLKHPSAHVQRTLAIAPGSPLANERQSSLLTRRLGRSSAAGNTLDEARAIPSYRGDRTYRDQVTSKQSDFYKLRLLVESDVNTMFRNRSSNALIVTALDAKGQPITVRGEKAKFKVRPNRSEAIELFGIPTGTYYLKVSTKGGKSSYRLKAGIERSCGCG